MNRRQFLQTGVAAAVLPWAWPRRSHLFQPQSQSALPPLPAPAADGWIDLFNGRNLDGFYTFLQRSGRDSDPKGYIRIENGLLHIMANEVTSENAEAGYICTHREFSNCRIRVEFKWGEKRYPPRLEAKRDNGLIYHVVGPDAVWPVCAECQIQETDCGDVFLLGGTTGTTGSLTNFNPGRGPAATPPAAAAGVAPATPNPRVRGNRILKEGDFEIRNDWNVIDVIVQNDRSAHLVNGRIVNALNNIRQPDPNAPGQFLPLMRGKIAVQVEYAEIWYRRIAVKLIA